MEKFLVVSKHDYQRYIESVLEVSSTSIRALHPYTLVIYSHVLRKFKWN